MWGIVLLISLLGAAVGLVTFGFILCEILTAKKEEDTPDQEVSPS